VGCALLVASLATLLLLAGCGRHNKSQEIVYVSAPQAFLRDRVAPVYSKTGVVKNGERLQVLDRDRRFVKVRTDGGTEGWLEQRYLITDEVYKAFQKLSQEHQSDPVQAAAVTRNDTNLHVDPSRDSDHLYQLTSGAKVSLLKRATSEKNLPGAPPKSAANAAAAKTAAPMEDWWLLRDAQGHVGWVLARMLDIDVPLEIAQYAEGQRIVAFFVLNEVADADKKVPQYLVALTESKDGMPFDFNQIRVFTWNVKRHRYETAYRERNFAGVLPITVSREDFGKEGVLPVFVIRVKDDNGNLGEHKYKLNTPIVRRVLAPGEEPPKASTRRKRR
jgi:SH3-like domain-containing protein